MNETEKPKNPVSRELLRGLAMSQPTAFWVPDMDMVDSIRSMMTRINAESRGQFRLGSTLNRETMIMTITKLPS